MFTYWADKLRISCRLKTSPAASAACTAQQLPPWPSPPAVEVGHGVSVINNAGYLFIAVHRGGQWLWDSQVKALKPSPCSGNMLQPLQPLRHKCMPAGAAAAGACMGSPSRLWALGHGSGPPSRRWSTLPCRDCRGACKPPQFMLKGAGEISVVHHSKLCPAPIATFGRVWGLQHSFGNYQKRLLPFPSQGRT